MFSFLTPFSPWLGALLAIPLVIHFLGRQRLRKEPFPSLMLLEERFAKSMQRHRLKNLLLLFLRTLLILCLFLALANPSLERTGGGGSKVESAAAIVHNGAYGLLPSESGGRESEIETQRRRLKSLDSLTGTRVRAVPLLEDGAGLSAAAARHGDYREAVARALMALDPVAASASLYLPVYAWADLEPAREALAAALRERPGLQLVLWDFGAAGARLTAFSAVRTVPSSRNPTVTLRAVLNPLAGASGPVRVRTLIGSRVLQEAPAGEGGIAEITLPLGEGARTAGRLTAAEGPDGAGFAVVDWHFAFPNPGRLTLAHVGSALASLPSLGRDNYYRRIVHVPAAKDIPWAGTPGPAPAPTLTGPGAGSLRLVYLSNERNTDAAAYGRIVEFVKRGGRLIIGVGRESDIPLLNRFLLQPLRMGRLGSVVDAGAGEKAEADPKALARLDGLPAAPGSLGLVRKRFAFTPDSGTVVLVTQGGGPVLALRDFHLGRALLWTTDLDDLEWSDVGVAPLVPLLHQAFQEGAGGLTANRAVASDSVLEYSLAEAGARAEVRDPEGRPFTRVRADGSRLRIGPFDRLGLHTVVQGGDTGVFAVNLEPRGPLPASRTEWEEWNADRRKDVMRGLVEFRGRVQVAAPEAGGHARTAIRPLWRAFFLAAILLLFLEGLIATAFSPDSRGRQAA